MAKKPPQDLATRSIAVVAKQASRWRAGMAFTSEPRTVDVTEEQFEAIATDPMLAIVTMPPVAPQS